MWTLESTSFFVENHVDTQKRTPQKRKQSMNCHHWYVLLACMLIIMGGAKNALSFKEASAGTERLQLQWAQGIYTVICINNQTFCGLCVSDDAPLMMLLQWCSCGDAPVVMGGILHYLFFSSLPLHPFCLIQQRYTSDDGRHSSLPLLFFTSSLPPSSWFSRDAPAMMKDE